MEILVKDLREVLELVRPLIPKNTTLPATRNLLIEGDRALATDLETFVTIQLDQSTPEPIMAPVLHALELLKRVPGNAVAMLTPTKTGLMIKAAGTTATLSHEKVDDFPPLPSDLLEHELVMDGSALMDALVEQARFAARDESRPVLNAVCLHLDNPVEVVAADGFRLSIRTLPGDLSQHHRNLILPLGAIRVLAHLWKLEAGVPDLSGVATMAEAAVAKRLVRIQYNDTQMRVTFGRITLGSRLMQGSFPNYRQLVPKEESSSVSFMGQDFLRAISLIGDIAKDGSAVARMEWEDGTMHLSARAGDVGEVGTDLALLSCSFPGKIAVNCSYLLAYAKAVPGVVTMKTTTPSSPVLLLSEGQPQVVLMPMFVQWGGEGPQPAPNAEGTPNPAGQDESEDSNEDQTVPNQESATAAEDAHQPPVETTDHDGEAEPPTTGNAAAPAKARAKKKSGSSKVEKAT